MPMVDIGRHGTVKVSCRFIGSTLMRGPHYIQLRVLVQQR
jgi:hypothetical protein